MVQIAASLLSANSLCYKSEIERALEAGVDRLHFDVMDHHFVPNLTFGPSICYDIRQEFPELIIDVHVMTYHVMELAKAFVDSGATTFTFHASADNDPRKIIDYLKSQNVQSGLAINPNQTLKNAMIEYIDHLDMVLVMSVMPGFGGQKWWPSSVNMLKECTAYKNEGRSFLLAVDGGINNHTSQKVIEAGADILVSGSYLFQHPSIEMAVNALKVN